LRDRTVRIFDEFFTAAVHGDIGRCLFRLFLDAGFDQPECRGEHRSSTSRPAAIMQFTQNALPGSPSSLHQISWSAIA
jgi:hypothetical protein